MDQHVAHVSVVFYLASFNMVLGHALNCLLWRKRALFQTEAHNSEWVCLHLDKIIKAYKRKRYWLPDLNTTLFLPYMPYSVIKY